MHAKRSLLFAVVPLATFGRVMMEMLEEKFQVSVTATWAADKARSVYRKPVFSRDLFPTCLKLAESKSSILHDLVDLWKEYDQDMIEPRF